MQVCAGTAALAGLAAQKSQGHLFLRRWSRPFTAYRKNGCLLSPDYIQIVITIGVDNRIRGDKTAVGHDIVIPILTVQYDDLHTVIFGDGKLILIFLYQGFPGQPLDALEIMPSVLNPPEAH